MGIEHNTNERVVGLCDKLFGAMAGYTPIEAMAALEIVRAFNAKVLTDGFGMRAKSGKTVKAKKGSKK